MMNKNTKNNRKCRGREEYLQAVHLTVISLGTIAVNKKFQKKSIFK